MKNTIVSLLVLFFCSIVCAEDLSGFWQTIDKKTKQPSSIIAVYPYQGKYYGKIVGTCNKQGAIVETLDQPKSRAPGIAGCPYYCGLDIIWACSAEGSGVFKGHVVDPKEGKKYTAKIWKERGNLILRGEIMMFGRNETLTQLPSDHWNAFFSQMNLANLTPVPYQLK